MNYGEYIPGMPEIHMSERHPTVRLELDFTPGLDPIETASVHAFGVGVLATQGMIDYIVSTVISHMPRPATGDRAWVPVVADRFIRETIDANLHPEMYDMAKLGMPESPHHELRKVLILAAISMHDAGILGMTSDALAYLREQSRLYPLTPLEFWDIDR